MTQSLTADRIQAALKYPFREPGWANRLLVPYALTLLGYFFFPALPWYMGYWAETMRRGVQGQPLELPDAQDWKRTYVEGLKAWGAGMVFTAPVIIPVMLAVLSIFSSSFAVTFLGERSGLSDDAIASLFLLSIGVGFSCIGLAVLLALPLSLIWPAAVCHMMARSEFAAAFRVRAWWPIFRANFAGFLTAFGVQILLGIVLALAMQILYFTVILACLFPLLIPAVAVYLALATGPLFGQAYRDGAERLAAAGGPPPAAEPPPEPNDAAA